MKCAYHFDNEAIAFCLNCGRGICVDCYRSVDKKSFCKECYVIKSIHTESRVTESPIILQRTPPIGIIIVALIEILFGLFLFFTVVISSGVKYGGGNILGIPVSPEISKLFTLLLSINSFYVSYTFFKLKVNGLHLYFALIAYRALNFLIGWKTFELALGSIIYAFPFFAIFCIVFPVYVFSKRNYFSSSPQLSQVVTETTKEASEKQELPRSQLEQEVHKTTIDAKEGKARIAAIGFVVVMSVFLLLFFLANR